MTTTATHAISGPLTANGVAPLPFDFQSISADEIAVLRNNVLVTTGYTVTRNGDGTGYIAPTSSWGTDSVIIYSNPTYRQSSEFERFAPLYPDAVEAALDRLSRTMLAFRRTTDQIQIALSGLALGALTALPEPVINFLSPLAGAVTRTLRSKLADTVSIKDFGAVGDGTTNDTPAFAAACAALGAAGGRIEVPNTLRCLIDTALTIPPNISIVGQHEFVGSPKDNTSAPYGRVGCALIVNPAITITLKGSASIKGLLIHAKNMTFPALNGSGFAGTAITAGGDDIGVSHCLIIGFNKAIQCIGYSRPRVESVWHDCNYGFEGSNILDIPYLDNIHGWPFATIAGGGVYTNHVRPGANVYLHDTVDWPKVTRCFSYGHSHNVRLENVNSATILNCGGDQPYDTAPLNTNSIGVVVVGTCYDTRIIGQQAAANIIGIYINTNAACHTLIDNATVWGGSTHAVLIEGGNATITGSRARGVSYGVTINNTTSKVFIDDNSFDDIVAQPIQCVVNSSTVVIGQNNNFGNYSLGNPVGGFGVLCPSIASAAALSPPNNGSVFNVSGSTNISTINNGWGGRRITLIFSSALTIAHTVGGLNSVRFNSGANFTTTANTALTLVHNGVQWCQA